MKEPWANQIHWSPLRLAANLLGCQPAIAMSSSHASDISGRSILMPEEHTVCHIDLPPPPPPPPLPQPTFETVNPKKVVVWITNSGIQHRASQKKSECTFRAVKLLHLGKVKKRKNFASSTVPDSLK